MARRLTKHEKRIATILDRLPLAREQIVVAMEELPPDFAVESFVAAAQSDDPAERNRVAVVERELDLLTNLLEELAARLLAPIAVASRLREAKDTRDDLDHFYPPASWRAVHAATEILIAELDRYVVRVVDWAHDVGIAVPGDPDA